MRALKRLLHIIDSFILYRYLSDAEIAELHNCSVMTACRYRRLLQCTSSTEYHGQWSLPVDNTDEDIAWLVERRRYEH